VLSLFVTLRKHEVSDAPPKPDQFQKRVRSVT
jgi:hypothetical protein